MVPRMQTSPPNSAGTLFDGLLTELPTILDRFFTSTISHYIGVVGSHEVAGKIHAV